MKIDKNIPIPSRSKSKDKLRQNMYDIYGFIFELEDGDSLTCNRNMINNYKNFCKKESIGFTTRWVDERDWTVAGYSDDGNYRIWFFPTRRFDKAKEKEMEYMKNKQRSN